MNNSKDNPTAVYRGYRRQVLYCLYRLFDEGLPDGSILQPEGLEDLAIYSSSGDLIEVVQVKDYSSHLTVSDFKPIFFERILTNCQLDTTVKVTIAHFGELGPELSAALDNGEKTPNRAIRTLADKGLTKNDVNLIFSHLKTHQVNESELLSFILAKLKNSVTSGAPQQAFENLMWWLMNASEGQLKINRQNAIEKVNEIGKFISQRLEHEEEWNTSILPISMKHSDCSEQQEREFYRGGRVHPVHIENNLDVRREELLRHLNLQFTDNNVVVVRSASGQGKTTLAYRYIADYSPSDFRFEILRPTDIQHARSMAQAISGHSEAIDVPTVLYLDVRPGDKAWLEFVREIAFLPKLRILITIREEDWFKSQVSANDFSFSEVILSFDEVTGKQLFSGLIKKALTNKYLNFEDAWAQFGERKTLFEFVYLLTQEEQLAKKIKEQVAYLQEEVRLGRLHRNELKLLKFVAVASAYEARIQLRMLVEHCELLEPQRTLQLFSDEFLLRTSDDGYLVEGFHPIRSEMMCSQLLDTVLDPWDVSAREVISLLDENDLELFLLCSFSRKPEFAEEIVSALSANAPHSWIGVRGISLALQWLGLNTYIDTNSQVIRDARTLVGSGWWTMLDWDVALIKGKRGLELFTDLKDSSPEFKLAADASEKLTALQTDKVSVFTYFESWIARLSSVSCAPSSVLDFTAMAEVMLWVGHLKITTHLNWVSSDLLDRALTVLPISLFGEFAIASRKISESIYNEWYDQNKEQIQTKLQLETAIISFEDEENCLVGHYLIDLDKKASFLMKRRESNQEDDSHILNNLAIERVDVLQRCIPGYECYGVIGYGHLFSLFKTLYDESTKRMPVENIMLPWLPSFNALARGVAKLRFRPETWEQYFDSIHLMRKGVLDGLGQLSNAIRVTNIKSRTVFSDFNQWNKHKSATSDEYMLPLVAVDEWGFIDETRTDNSNLPLFNRFSTLEQLESFAKSVTNYRHSVGNFMRQSQDAIVLVRGLRAADSELKRNVCLETAKELGIQENCIALSITNGIDALKLLEDLLQHEIILKEKVHQGFFQKDFLDREIRVLHKVVYRWCKFAYPEQFPTSKPHTKKKRAKNPLKGNLRDCLVPTLNRIQHSLKSLKKQGIRAYIHKEDVRWEREKALWIVFDVDIAIDTLEAVEIMFATIVEALQPDNEKKVRQAALGYYWQRIILVPLVRGKSIEQSAFTNMQIATAHFSTEDVSEQIWKFIPEQVSDEIWNKLSLPLWEKSDELFLFQRFVDAYGNLYQHIEHLSDITRIELLDANSVGESIAKKHLENVKTKSEPYLQQSFDALEAIFNYISKQLRELESWDELDELRPNIYPCYELLTDLREAVTPPAEEEGGTYLLLGEELTIWRDQLKEGLNTLGIARYLWISDFLER